MPDQTKISFIDLLNTNLRFICNYLVTGVCQAKCWALLSPRQYSKVYLVGLASYIIHVPFAPRVLSEPARAVLWICALSCVPCRSSEIATL